MANRAELRGTTDNLFKKYNLFKFISSPFHERGMDSILWNKRTTSLLTNYSTTGFLHLSTDILAWITVTLKGCPAASLASAHSMPAAPYLPPGWDNQKCPPTLPKSSGGGGQGGGKITLSWELLQLQKNGFQEDKIVHLSKRCTDPEGEYLLSFGLVLTF